MSKQQFCFLSVSGVRSVVLPLVPLTFVLAVSVAPAQSTGKNPRYSHLFNCMCQVEVQENGEVDMSRNCGKNLSDCSCGFAKKMKRQLRNMDRKDMPRERQIKRMKYLYQQFGIRVLDIPDSDGSTQVLGYVIPPAILFLGLLFVGSVGWYWLADPEVSGVNDDARNSGSLSADASDDLEREIEREIEDRRRTS